MSSVMRHRIRAEVLDHPVLISSCPAASAEQTLLDAALGSTRRKHREHYFGEELTFADADAILSMWRELCPNLVDSRLPVWIRILAYRPVLLQRPDEPALLREAAQNPWLHGPDRDDSAGELAQRAGELEVG
ncbi:hypothetical protein ABT247_33180 [Kitasatospora sp. NPDC001539]|uniref:hypothetical protein n=1 Tax=Kitasatospora sp. NPDC001539 TaxID=3154384 RepID=UPI0033251CFB